MIDRSREKSRVGLGLISCRWKEWGWDSSERRGAIFSKDTVAKLIVRTDDLWDRISRIVIREKSQNTRPWTARGSRQNEGKLFKVCFFSFRHAYTLKLCHFTCSMIAVKRTKEQQRSTSSQRLRRQRGENSWSLRDRKQRKQTSMFESPCNVNFT